MPASPYSRLVPAGLALLLGAASPASPLSGRMILAAAPAAHFEIHHDRFGYAAGGGDAIRELPAIGFTVVQDGEFLLPVEQDIRDVGHPHWEVALQPGRIRTDHDGERHAELPFALVERNANCTHNGLLAWRFDDAGRVFRASWQIDAETCAYYKFDMRGTAQAVFDPGPVASAGEVRAAFRAYRRARLPVVAIERIGERYPHRFVYHTSDTYVAGAAMRALLERAYGRDVTLYDELLVGPAWRKLNLSPIARQARTTYDETRQPLTGWGLTFVSDDVARIGNWLNAEGARIDARAVLDGKLFDAAMQRDPADRGLEAGSPQFRYNNGFWAHDVAAYIGCEHPVWVPFMSGYGGISVVLFPNGSTYYYFSDGYTQRWREAAVAADRIGSMCS